MALSIFLTCTLFFVIYGLAYLLVIMLIKAKRNTNTKTITISNFGPVFGFVFHTPRTRNTIKHYRDRVHAVIFFVYNLQVLVSCFNFALQLSSIK